jgi:hypothetical protein
MQKYFLPDKYIIMMKITCGILRELLPALRFAQGGLAVRIRADIGSGEIMIY